MKKIFALILMTLFLSIPIFASVNYPGSFPNLETALKWAATMEADKTVILGAGTFTGADTGYNIDWPNVSGVKLIGQGMGVTTLDAQGGASLTRRIVLINTSVSLSLEALTLANGSVYDNHGADIWFNSAATLARLYLKNVLFNGGLVDASANSPVDLRGGHIYCPVTTISVEAENCIFRNGYADWSNGASIWGGNITARKCYFIGNAARNGAVFHSGVHYLENCIFTDNAAYQGNIAHSSNTKTINCTFYKNIYGASEGGQGGAIAYSPSSWISTNSIYWNNYTGGVYTFLSGTVGTNSFKNCCITPTAGTINTINCITSNESQFVSASVPYDLHLKVNSVCIDTGTWEGSPAYAYDGVKRPQPSTNPLLNFDMGVYEQARANIPMIVVLQPNGEESLTGNTTYEVKWQISSTIEPSSTVYVRLSTDGGATWPTLIRSQTATIGTSSYVWTVSNTSSSNCLISVEAKGFGGWNNDTSNNVFTIVATTDTTPPIVNIIKPNGGEFIRGGTTYPVTWYASDETTPCQNLSVEVFYTPATGWVHIAATHEGATGVGTYEWAVPLITTSMAKMMISITDEAGNFATDESNAVFWIDSTAPYVVVTVPTSGDTYNATNYVNLTFTEPMVISTVTSSITIEPNPGAFMWITSWNSISTEVTFSISLFKGSRYYVTILNGNDRAGNPMAGPFTLWFDTSADILAPTVEVTYPNGGEHLRGGTTIEVTWTATDDSGIASNGTTIRYSGDSGATWNTIGSGLPSTGIYSWEVARINSDNCRVTVEVRDIYSNIGSDMSDANFQITSEALTVPTIEVVYFNNRRFRDKDVLSPEYSFVRIDISDANNIATAEMTVNATEKYALIQDPLYPPSEKMWSGAFVMPPQPGTKRFEFFIRNDLGFMNSITYEGAIIGGGVQVVGKTFNYPNPFKPLGQQVTTIQYTLNADAPITIIIYDITGVEVKRMTFASGKNGGMAGTNMVPWNGKSQFNKVVGDGIFIYKIIARNAVIGTGKLTIRD